MSRSVTRLAGLALTLAVALGAGGCNLTARSGGGDVTGSIAPVSEAQARGELDQLAARYRASPSDIANTVRYGRALRATGQGPQAVAVLERVAISDQRNTVVLGEYGRALADVGRFDQALEVLARSHRPEQPDWRIINVQGSIFDQMGRHDEAQRAYEAALRISPGQPTVLANLGLSYALARKLPQAEQVLRQAAAHPQADARVRQNLALVVGLQGRFQEAEEIARRDLPPAEAEQNVAAIRQMVSQQNTWRQLGQQPRRPGQAVPQAQTPPRG